MQQAQAELIDIDFYCDLLDESDVIEIIQDGELNLHRLIHPRRGFLTAIQGGRYALLVAGDFHDNRGLPVTAALYAFGGASERPAEAVSDLPGIIVPFPSKNAREVSHQA